MTHRLLALRAGAVLAASLLAMPWAPAQAQAASNTPGAAERYPAAAMAFLNQELPEMEAAVSARDRDYFEQAMARTVDFSQAWGFKVQANPALAPYRACTDAISDFTIVGLCRIAPSLSGCEPGLVPQFNANVDRCRALAAAR